MPSPEMIFLVDEPGLRLDSFLSRASQKSREFVQEQIQAGRVQINGKVAAKSSARLKPGDRIEVIFIVEPALGLIPVPGNLDILFEDEAILVLNKAQGVVVHPAAGHRGETLVHHLLHHFGNAEHFSALSPTRPGIVHRLDRGTSGVLLVAKQREVQENLSRQFKERVTKKEYESLAWGKMKDRGSFDSMIGRHRTDRKKMSSKTLKGRTALTHFQTSLRFAHVSHVHLFPHTGRTHQLRVHCAEAGNPILGDALYATRSVSLQTKQLHETIQATLAEIKYPFLHAKKLSFLHPQTNESLSFEAPRPANFQTMLDLLGVHDAALV